MINKELEVTSEDLSRTFTQQVRFQCDSPSPSAAARGDFIGHAVIPDPGDMSRVISHAYIFVCCANDIVENSVTDAISALREAGEYKHEIKYQCRRVLSGFTRYHAALQRSINTRGRYELWMELADRYCAELQPHVDKLYWQMAQSLLDIGKPSCRVPVMARVLTAECMLNLSVQNFDNYFRAGEQRLGADLRCLFLGGDLTQILNLWRGVVRILFGGPTDNLVLNDGCVLAVDVLRKQITRFDRMERLTTEIVNSHPGLKEMLDRENKSLAVNVSDNRKGKSNIKIDNYTAV